MKKTFVGRLIVSPNFCLNIVEEETLAIYPFWMDKFLVYREGKYRKYSGENYDEVGIKPGTVVIFTKCKLKGIRVVESVRLARFE